jgi:phosphohistidine phosphatase SixA
MSIRIEGTEEFKQRVDQVASDGRDRDVRPSEIFTDGFVRTHTTFESIGEFFAESPWQVESDDDFRAIPSAELDAYVDEYTGFSSWETMLSTAAREWILRQSSE